MVYNSITDWTVYGDLMALSAFITRHFSSIESNRLGMTGLRGGEGVKYI